MQDLFGEKKRGVRTNFEGLRFGLWADYEEFYSVGGDGGGEGFGVGSEVFLSPEVSDLLGGPQTEVG